MDVHASPAELPELTRVFEHLAGPLSAAGGPSRAGALH